MAAVSEVAGMTYFEITLERDPPMNLTEFYHELIDICAKNTPKSKMLKLTLWTTEDSVEQDMTMIKESK